MKIRRLVAGPRVRHLRIGIREMLHKERPNFESEIAEGNRSILDSLIVIAGRSKFQVAYAGGDQRRG